MAGGNGLEKFFREYQHIVQNLKVKLEENMLRDMLLGHLKNCKDTPVVAQPALRNAHRG